MSTLSERVLDGRIVRVCIRFLLLCLFFTIASASENLETEADVKNAWVTTPIDPVSPFEGASVKIESLKHALYCGARDLVSPAKCIRYQYKSNAFMEAFIVNREAYQARIDQGLELTSDVIRSGSYCVGSSCGIVADVNGLEDWCIMFLNIDPELISASVQFEYKVCQEDDHTTDLLWILGITCVALVFVSLITCLTCCCILKRRQIEQQNRKEEDDKEDLFRPLNLPPPFPPPIPNSTDVFFTIPPPPPISSHIPFNHETPFQMQQPLPISHVPPPPLSSRPSSAHEMPIQPIKSEKRRSRIRTMSRIPINTT